MQTFAKQDVTWAPVNQTGVKIFVNVVGRSQIQSNLQNVLEIAWHFVRARSVTLGTGKKDAKDKTHALAALTGKKMVETLGRERNALDEFSLSAAFGYF